MSATSTNAPSAATTGISAFRALPRAGLRDVAGGLQRYFRPDTERSPLRRLGDRFVVDLPGLPRLLVSCSPEDAKVILADREQALSLGQALHRMTPHPVLFGGDSLIFLEGDEHTRERRKLAPPFHGTLMKSHEPAMIEIACERIEDWPTGRPLEFVGLAQQFVLDVMRTVIFGVSSPERMRALDHAMRAYCHVTESDGFLALGALGVLLPMLVPAARARVVLEPRL